MFVNFYYRSADKADRVNIWVNRDKPYHKHGRYQTEEEALEVDKELHSLLEAAHTLGSEPSRDYNNPFLMDYVVSTLETDTIINYLKQTGRIK